MYKKLTLISVALLGFSAAAMANENSATYIGAQLGKTIMNYESSDYTFSNNSVDDEKFGGRLYLGYAFTEFLAAELGYGYYGKPEFKHDPDGNTQDITQQGVDLVGKISLPLDYGIGFYVKAGGIWMHRSELESRGGFFPEKSSNGRLAPLGGLGITYNFNPKVAAELFWTGSATSGNLPKMYFYGLGLSYKFLKNTDTSGM